MLDTIFRRQSIRVFKAEMPDEDTLLVLAKAALSAPSARNRQPVHLLFVKNRETLEQMRQNHPYMDMLKTAPLCVVVCAKPEGAPLWLQDAAAATENLLLAATELHLGSCWCGVAQHQERVNAFKRVLKLPPDVEPFAAVPLGYPDEQPPYREKIWEGKLHWDVF